MEFQRKFTTSIFHVKLYNHKPCLSSSVMIDRNNNNPHHFSTATDNIVNFNHHRCSYKFVYLLADRWGLKFYLNNPNNHNECLNKTFQNWLWKIDCYCLVYRSATKSTLFIRNFSSRSDIRLEFINVDECLRFIYQCENFLFIEQQFKIKKLPEYSMLINNKQQQSTTTTTTPRTTTTTGDRKTKKKIFFGKFF
ncbi:hypothetical protein DERP_011244 [Dermatophagoides pteronyssinus]|uniref:Uncharacterized protein n=1 Tax=Dermatophagoides pteronyssinus TaxID=6956 RepID=A0ABQ8JD30_DERPT|nr:hypothetical protein DERP_011244 [Dermatophagoides pteronyssinus]